MSKNPPKIELSWRDENYGSVYAVPRRRHGGPQPLGVEVGIFAVREEPEPIPARQVAADALSRQLDVAGEQRGHHDADRHSMVDDQLYVTIAGRVTALIVQRISRSLRCDRRGAG